MQAEKERIIKIINEMPETEARQVIDFVDNLDNDLGAPQDLRIENEADLNAFLEEGVEALKNNQFSSFTKTVKMLKSFQN